MNQKQQPEWVIKGNLVDAEQVIYDGWLAIADGKIIARGTGEAPQAPKTVDASGKWIMPGVIDGQVHSGSQANQEGLGWASRAAAAGGITVMVDMPYDDPEPVACRERSADRDSHLPPTHSPVSVVTPPDASHGSATYFLRLR